MAFGTEYKAIWLDVEDVKWEIDFQIDGGSAGTELTPGATPAILTWHGGDKYQPIVGSSLDIQLVYSSTVDNLYTEGAQTMKVILNRDSTAIWYGWLQPGQSFRAFNKAKYYVTLTASCGLGELKEIKFEDGSGDPYFGQATEMAVISNILQKTGFQLNIYDTVNIFDANHTTGAAYSPLNQTYLYQEAYWDERTDERADCYTVLSDILTKYGATVRQRANWYILRPNVYSVATVYWRLFTYAGVYSSNGSYTAYDTIDTPSGDLYYVHADQELSKLPGLGSCEITQSPPRRSNMIRNGSFDLFTWTGGVPDYWDDVYSSGTTLDISSDNDQLKMGACGNSSIPTEYIELSTTIDFATSVNLSFDWTPTYTGSPTYKTLVIQIYSVTFAKYLVSGAWQAGVGYVSFTAGASGTEIRESFEIPDDGSGFGRGNTLRFRIYEFYCEQAPAANYYHLNNLLLEVEMSKPETRLHSHTNADYTINNISKKEIVMGDSWRSDFGTSTSDYSYYINTYAASDSGSLTTLWSITGDQTAAAKIGAVLARQTVEGFRRSLEVINGSIRGNSTLLPRVAIRDTDFTDESGYAKHFYPTQLNYDTRLNEWNGTWIECPVSYTDESIEWASSDYYTYTIGPGPGDDDYLIEVSNSAGDGTATSDAYTAVAYEPVRVVLVLTDSGSSDLPSCAIGGNSVTVAWGTNYLETVFTTSGNKTIVMGGDDAGDTHNYSASITAFYSLTGF